MNEIRVINAQITGARWEVAHGCLSHMLILSYEGGGIGFGGYNLKDEACYDWITNIMRVLEIDDFNEKSIIGKIIRIKTNDSGYREVVAIGHPLKDIWFNPDEFYKQKYRSNGGGQEAQKEGGQRAKA